MAKALRWLLLLVALVVALLVIGLVVFGVGEDEPGGEAACPPQRTSGGGLAEPGGSPSGGLVVRAFGVPVEAG